MKYNRLLGNSLSLTSFYGGCKWNCSVLTTDDHWDHSPRRRRVECIVRPTGRRTVPSNSTALCRYSTVVRRVQRTKRQYVCIHRSVKCLKITIITKSPERSVKTTHSRNKHQWAYYHHKHGDRPVATELVYEYMRANETVASSVLLLWLKQWNQIRMSFYVQHIHFLITSSLLNIVDICLKWKK